MRAARRAAPLLLCAWLGACGDDKPPEKPAAGPKAPGEGAEGAAPRAAAAPAAPAAAPPPGLLPPQSPAREKLIADLRKRPFRPEEMAPVPPGNTDPFHNNLEKFITAPPPPDKGTIVALLPKYSLEELKLTAIILGSGDVTASRAMLIDPAGVGHTIKRGDRVSKAAAVVQRILSDRVLFEFTEDAGQGKKRTTVRAVELHPTEAQDNSPGGAPRGPVATPK